MVSDMKQSYVGAFRAWTAALLAAESEILGKGRVWKTGGPDANQEQQRRFLSKVLPVTVPEADKVAEVEKIVAWSADPINSFLKSRGFSIELEQLGPDTFGFATVMKIMVQWLVEGERRYIFNDLGEFRAARIEAGYTSQGETVTIRSAKHHSELVATLKTRSDDVVHITKFDEDIDPIDLSYRAAELLDGASEVHGYAGVQFPFVDLDVKPDVSWMLGMWTKTDGGGEATLVQALQQCKLRMNHRGAVVEDAAAGACVLESCCIPRDLIIDRSFLFVLERPGCKLPIFSAVVRPDSWKDPGDLGI